MDDTSYERFILAAVALAEALHVGAVIRRRTFEDLRRAHAIAHEDCRRRRALLETSGLDTSAEDARLATIDRYGTVLDLLERGDVPSAALAMHAAAHDH